MIPYCTQKFRIVREEENFRKRLQRKRELHALLLKQAKWAPQKKIKCQNEEGVVFSLNCKYSYSLRSMASDEVWENVEKHQEEWSDATSEDELARNLYAALQSSRRKPAPLVCVVATPPAEELPTKTSHDGSVKKRGRPAAVGEHSTDPLLARQASEYVQLGAECTKLARALRQERAQLAQFESAALRELSSKSGRVQKKFYSSDLDAEFVLCAEQRPQKAEHERPLNAKELRILIDDTVRSSPRGSDGKIVLAGLLLRLRAVISKIANDKNNNTEQQSKISVTKLALRRQKQKS